MKILVINSGSSSLKYQLIDMNDEKVLAKGLCEKIGETNSNFEHKTFDGRKLKKLINMNDHKEAFVNVKNILIDREYGVVKNLDEISAVGHRIVQGGNLFKDSVVVNDDVVRKIESLIPLAPLHNDANLHGIIACKEVLNVPQVAVFDTSFHSTMPPKAYMFALPYEYYEKYNVRRYGFHGTSHRYVSNRCAELMKKDLRSLKLITCHIGNGSSITAINKGEVLDTSMGLTPLDGIMMGTRCGAIDPSVVTFIADKENLSFKEMDNLMNKKSGLLGVSGISNDDRDVLKAAKEGNKRAILAHEMLRYQMTKIIGGYIAALQGCDAIVFTAGVGENQWPHREAVCENLSFMGIDIDKDLNQNTILGREGKITTSKSKIPVYVIPTNEELVIARDTKRLIKK